MIFGGDPSVAVPSHVALDWLQRRKAHLPGAGTIQYDQSDAVE